MIAHSLISVLLAALFLTGWVCGQACAETDILWWPPPQEVMSIDALGRVGHVEVPQDKPEATQAVVPILPGPEKTAQPQAPDDPCLPGLYKDWRELSQDSLSGDRGNGFARVRIVINRSDFNLVLEGIRRDGAVEEIYRTPVALGDIESPTPEGEFIINHAYCYPDVAFFPADADPIPGLYKGFFAPILACDEDGRCERFQELGMHGFEATALPNHRGMRVDTYGAVSAGCIRLPDPCKFKSVLAAAVGLGPLKKNDRGSYHWLNKPVQVSIVGNYPGTEDETTVASVVEQGLLRLHDGLKSLFGAFQ
ncbi:MAG: L,D-transpeptidase [Desulfomonile tiedjei]|nr:L,D-transpeptidase [Desulfomonile tiedjei]